MIQRKLSHKFLAGHYPCYVKVDFPGFLTLSREKIRMDHLGIGDLTEKLDLTCKQLFGLDLSPARMAKKMFLKLGDDFWMIGFKQPEHLETFLGNLGNKFTGTAYTVRNASHFDQLTEYQSKGWIIMDSNTKKALSRFKIWIKKQHVADERVAKFVQNTQIKHLQTPTFHVLCVDSEDLVARSKLTFPDIDKIEAYINVNQLGEENNE